MLGGRVNEGRGRRERIGCLFEKGGGFLDLLLLRVAVSNDKVQLGRVDGNAARILTGLVAEEHEPEYEPEGDHARVDEVGRLPIDVLVRESDKTPMT